MGMAVFWLSGGSSCGRALFGFAVSDQIGDGGVLENSGGGVADGEKDLIESAVISVFGDETAELLGVAQGSERAVDEADDVAQGNFGGRAAQLISATRAADAVDDASVLQFEENQFEEFFRQIALGGDFADLNGTLLVAPSERHHSLQRVKSLLRDLHSAASCGMIVPHFEVSA
jgi:hypothetical protein